MGYTVFLCDSVYDARSRICRISGELGRFPCSVTWHFVLFRDIYVYNVPRGAHTIIYIAMILRSP